MTNERREAVYLRQNGSETRLTGPQRRRLKKKGRKTA
jgi:hypothetical protein